MLVNALSLVKSCYLYIKFSRLIQITKKKGENNKRLFPNTKSFQKIFSTPFYEKSGAAFN